jgi:hypothetical protein
MNPVSAFYFGGMLGCVPHKQSQPIVPIYTALGLAYYNKKEIISPKWIYNGTSVKPLCASMLLFTASSYGFYYLFKDT